MHWLDKQWQTTTLFSLLMLPISWLYCFAVAIRRLCYRLGVKRSHRLPVPVIIVGNITVGGTGKTPLVIWLAQFLRQAGYRPGILSRGYRGRSETWPQEVHPKSDPNKVGDEAVLLARRSECPVFVGPSRVQAAMALLSRYQCDILLSDDGLQHYALKRDIEIALIDGARRFGNGHCLPAGPLREPISRLHEVNISIINGKTDPGELSMELVESSFRRVNNKNHAVSNNYFSGRRQHAIAGIGYPKRFFDKLRTMGLDIIEHSFPDHYRFTPEDIQFINNNEVIMTEKDAVKCEEFADHRHWFLVVEARPNPRLGEKIMNLLREKERE